MNLCLDLVLVQALAVVVEVVLHGVDHEVDEVVPPGLGVHPVLDALGPNSIKICWLEFWFENPLEFLLGDSLH